MSHARASQQQPLPYPALILAGGRSRRMGKDKALLPLGSETVLQRVHRVFEALCVRTVLVMGHDAQWSPQVAFDRMVRDENQDFGPLEGLRVGMRSLLEDDLVLVGTCDAPLVVPAVYRQMVECFRDAERYDAVVPMIQGQPYPLTAVYRTSVFGRISQMVDSRQLRVKDLLGDIRVREIAESEIRALDPTLQTLRNINTQQEYAALLKDLQ